MTARKENNLSFDRIFLVSCLTLLETSRDGQLQEEE